jgi:hypothetical protein
VFYHFSILLISKKLLATKVENRKKTVHNILENLSHSGSLIAKSLEMNRLTVNRIIIRFNGSLSIDRQPAGRPKRRPRSRAAAMKMISSIHMNQGLSDVVRAKKYAATRNFARKTRFRAGSRSYQATKQTNCSAKQDSTA